tara:strand:- start:62 stop:454 length:393 start_codon:yes stop_codon:yes gene_type:complete
MEKNVIFWAIGIILVASVIFSTNDLTGNVTITKDPLITISNPLIKGGSLLNIEARNIETSQELKIYTKDGKYTSKRFYTRASRCERMGKDYLCNLQYRIPPSMTKGDYYVQAKNKRDGIMVGNKAQFTVM